MLINKIMDKKNELHLNLESPSSPQLRKSFDQQSLERKMSTMRERFKILQQMEEMENSKQNDDENFLDLKLQDNSMQAKKEPPTSRWGKLRMVVRADTKGSMLSINPSPFSSPRALNNEVNEVNSDSDKLEIDDIEFYDFWKNYEVPKPDISDDIDKDMLSPPESTDFETDFENETKPLSLLINRIPEKVVHDKQKEAETNAFEEQRKKLKEIKLKELDVVWRENLARERIKKIEKDIKMANNAEKEKMYIYLMEKEKKLARDFRRLREELEKGIKRQEAAVFENFGKLLIHEDVSVYRLY